MRLDSTLPVPGATLRHTTGGTGDSWVVFVHGAGLDHTMFAAQADAVVAAGHRVVLWDLRGHGLSPLEAGARFTADDALADLGALITELGIDRPVLIGHSLGGNLAQAYARANGESVRALIVVDATWNAGPLTAVERWGLRMAAPLLGLIPASALPRMMARASAVTPDAIRRAEDTFARMPKRTFLDVWRATTSLVSPEPGYRSPVPLGLIRGAEDRAGNIATAMPAWAETEGVRENVIPGAGHIVTEDAPDATSRAIIEILAGLPRER